MVVEQRKIDKLLGIGYFFLVDDIEVQIRVLFAYFQYMFDVGFSFVHGHFVHNIGEIEFTVFYIFEQGRLKDKEVGLFL